MEYGKLKAAPTDRPVILIADDEVFVLNVVRLTLEQDGYFILTASDGDEALFISRQYPGRIDLVISDITMPKLSGFEVKERILAERPGTKVLLISGHSQTVVGIPFLRKPFLPIELRQKVREMISIRSGFSPGSDTPQSPA
jgi:CheY-like chemotaxis protein